MNKVAPLALVFLLLVLAAACSGSGGGDTDGSVEDGRDGGVVTDLPPARPPMGLLQGRIRHNLHDDTCLAANDCFLQVEEMNDTVQWLSRIREHSDLAVLHWDGNIPWLVFSEDPPLGTDRVSFYNGRLDAAIRSWIDLFEIHFASMPRRYLAVTPLWADRTRLENLRVDENVFNVEVTPEPCPRLEPGTVVQFEYDPGGGPVAASFDLERTYRNFVMYLYDRMQPDYLALMIEVNMFKEACPGQWDGLARLYRSLHDSIRAEVGDELKIFVTMTYQDLLKYDLDACVGGLEIQPCGQQPQPPNYPDPVAANCFPLDLSAISDLDQGDRLDILALSFYLDFLLMTPPGWDPTQDNMVSWFSYPWNGVDDCLFRAWRPPFVDPLEQLERFGWSKPVAIAETGMRTCPTHLIWTGDPQYTIRMPTSQTPSGGWLQHALGYALEKRFEFFVYTFLEDYRPIGLWMLALPPPNNLPFEVFNAFNNFPCMGLYDDQGQTKGTVTDVWLETLR